MMVGLKTYLQDKVVGCCRAERGAPKEEDDAPRSARQHPTVSKIDIETLVLHVLNKPASFLYAHPEYELTEGQVKDCDALIARRLAGEPVAYILGHKEFWSLDFAVNEHTLIPRPETELLVELALKVDAKRVLDLGTGSGAIAVAMKYENLALQVVAVDQSIKALEVAKQNAKSNGVDVEFIHSNWFDGVDDQQFDLIVSNPPYLAEDDVHLNQGDLRFEPNSALVAGQDGLNDIRFIAEHAKAYMSKSGMLMFEHGFDQGPAVRDIFAVHGYCDIETFQDLAGHDRVTKAIVL